MFPLLMETIKVANALCLWLYFSVEYAISFPSGALPSIRHNDIRDLTVRLLTEVCPNDSIEPELQVLTGENYLIEPLIMRMELTWMSQHRGFGASGMTEHSLMYINFVQPSCSQQLQVFSHCDFTDVMRISRREAMIREVENGSFTPLVFSASGGMAPAATITFKRMASLIAEKQQQDYNKTIAWIKCLLRFSLVRSSVTDVPQRSKILLPLPEKPDFDTLLDVALSEWHIPTH